MPSDFVSLVIDPTTSTTVYVPTSSHGVYKSIDGGGSWTPINSGLPPVSSRLPASVCVYSLVIDPTTSNRLYVSTTSGVYKSIDGRASWTCHCLKHYGQVYGGILSIDPTTPTILYAGNNKSIDGGATWQPINWTVDGFSLGVRSHATG